MTPRLTNSQAFNPTHKSICSTNQLQTYTFIILMTSLIRLSPDPWHPLLRVAVAAAVRLDLEALWPPHLSHLEEDQPTDHSDKSNRSEVCKTISLNFAPFHNLLKLCTIKTKDGFGVGEAFFSKANSISTRQYHFASVCDCNPFIFFLLVQRAFGLTIFFIVLFYFYFLIFPWDIRPYERSLVLTSHNCTRKNRSVSNCVIFHLHFCIAQLTSSFIKLLQECIAQKLEHLEKVQSC